MGVHKFDKVGTCKWHIRGCTGNASCVSGHCHCNEGFSSQDGSTCVPVQGPKVPKMKGIKMKMGKTPMFEFKPDVPGLDGSWYDDFLGDQNFAVLSPMRVYRPRAARWVH